MRVMKTVNKEMKRKGVTMKRFYANFPLCCPSRTTLLTGQYAHNHEVLSNQAPDGGYGVFNELHGDNNLAIWLQEAGYTTVLHRQVPERVRGAGRVRHAAHRRAAGAGTTGACWRRRTRSTSATR